MIANLKIKTNNGINPAKWEVYIDDIKVDGVYEIQIDATINDLPYVKITTYANLGDLEFIKCFIEKAELQA